MKATAIANSNIAFVKYWGKKDESRIIPMNPSISMTLDNNFSTKTTVELSKKLKQDTFILNDRYTSGIKLQRVTKFLDFIRPNSLKAKVSSVNSYPTGAGIASSASGFAALAAACNNALNLGFSLKKLSGLARQGSGSAARSIYGGFVEWKSEYAVQIYDENYWSELRDVVVILSKKEKKISSREAMKLTVEKSMLYKKRIRDIQITLKNVRVAINEKNFRLLANEIMKDSDNMHSCITEVDINYLNKDSIKMKQIINNLNNKEIKAGYTFDAGPNCHIITLEKNLPEIKEALINYSNIIISKPGNGIRLSKDHLF